MRKKGKRLFEKKEKKKKFVMSLKIAQEVVEETFYTRRPLKAKLDVILQVKKKKKTKKKRDCLSYNIFEIE